MSEINKAAAEKYFRGVYGGDPTIIEALARSDIVTSYPLFNELFGTPALQGREAVKAFAVRFSKRWIQPKIIVHDAISEKNNVVLLWSFQAMDGLSRVGNEQREFLEHSWGGITLIRLDDAGKIVAEVGEESSPGPFARLRVDEK